MQVIYKYELTVGPNRLDLPADAQVLCVQAQRNRIQLWALITPNEPPSVERIFDVAGTGQICLEGSFGEYIGTVQLHNGIEVWHVFERGEQT